MKAAALCLGLLAATAAYDVNLSRPYHMQLFTDYQDSASNTYRYVTHPVADLSELDDRFFDSISSVCGTGLWIGYNERNFTYNGIYNWPNYWPMVDQCHEIWPEMDNQVRSLRFAGHPTTFNRPVATLYEHTEYAGQEIYFSGDRWDISATFPETKSIIVTGNSSWTFFEEPGYQGAQQCVTPSKSVGSSDLVLNYGVMSVLTIAKVNSMKMGCDSTRDDSASLASPLSPSPIASSAPLPPLRPDPRPFQH